MPGSREGALDAFGATLRKTGAAAGSDEQLDHQLRAILENLQQVTKEDEPVERDDLRPGIAPYLDDETSERKAIYDRLVAIENEKKTYAIV